MVIIARRKANYKYLYKIVSYALELFTGTKKTADFFTCGLIFFTEYVLCRLPLRIHNP